MSQCQDLPIKIKIIWAGGGGGGGGGEGEQGTDGMSQSNKEQLLYP